MLWAQARLCVCTQSSTADSLVDRSKSALALRCLGVAAPLFVQ